MNEEPWPPEGAPEGDAFEAVMTAPACPHCGEGETWSVKCHDGDFIGQDWQGEDAQVNAEECATQLNWAFEKGQSVSSVQQEEAKP